MEQVEMLQRNALPFCQPQDPSLHPRKRGLSGKAKGREISHLPWNRYQIETLRSGYEDAWLPGTAHLKCQSSHPADHSHLPGKLPASLRPTATSEVCIYPAQLLAAFSIQMATICLNSVPFWGEIGKVKSPHKTLPRTQGHKSEQISLLLWPLVTVANLWLTKHKWNSRFLMLGCDLCSEEAEAFISKQQQTAVQ